MGHYAKSKRGIIVLMPPNFDLLADYDAPQTYVGISRDLRRREVRVDHDATGTNTPGTGDTVVTILRTSR